MKCRTETLSHGVQFSLPTIKPIYPTKLSPSSPLCLPLISCSLTTSYSLASLRPALAWALLGKANDSCSFVISPFCDNDFVKSFLVDMYANCGSPDDVHAVLDSIKFKDLVPWNAMLSAYARSGRKNVAL
ncbi:hypothetical protein Pint_26336 [Pistacia integerrima]|uniref:Uncharacterized protein n=1 Tax=Pistacia integerrima TaxID=434235 RepID=A0ACC0YHE3_9ROSI|nr:hypothetical protein Pint_26336 [Pistacia integerrima]